MLRGMEPMPQDPALVAASPAPERPDAIPGYLRRTYTWAYLDPRALRVFDRPGVVSAILWGNARRLMRMAIDEFRAGDEVLQAACVYGDFSQLLAQRIGPAGRLEIVDVAPVQVANARRKLAASGNVKLRQADLARPGCVPPEGHDAVCCFFLLHEVPERERRVIVDNLLAAVKPGGRIVFVDYHRPSRGHPLGPIMWGVFRWLEPYAASLFDVGIETRSARSADFAWQKTTCFGGLYQKLVGVRRA